MKPGAIAGIVGGVVVLLIVILVAVTGAQVGGETQRMHDILEKDVHAFVPLSQLKQDIQAEGYTVDSESPFKATGPSHLFVTMKVTADFNADGKMTSYHLGN